LIPLNGLIGQERAKRSREIELKLRQQGYNIFVTRETGNGRNW